jgi:hypothetical protein
VFAEKWIWESGSILCHKQHICEPIFELFTTGSEENVNQVFSVDQFKDSGVHSVNDEVNHFICVLIFSLNISKNLFQLVSVDRFLASCKLFFSLAFKDFIKFHVSKFKVVSVTYLLNFQIGI